MSGEPTITIIGNTTAPAELRYVASGKAVASFTVASTPKNLNRQTNQWEDGEPLFVRCSVWENFAENVAESLVDKGIRVVVTGKLVVRSYEWEGAQRTSIEMRVDAIGPDLRYARAQVTKVARSQGPGAPVSQGAAPSQAPANDYDPWATGGQPDAVGQFGDLPPF